MDLSSVLLNDEAGRATSPGFAEAIAVAEQIAPLEREWDELADRVAAGPFLRPGWIAAWWAAFGVGQLQILTLRRGNSLAGVIPMYRSRGALHSTTNAHTPEFGILAEDGAAAQALCRALMAGDTRRISVGALDGSAASALARAATAAGRSATTITTGRSPYIHFSDEVTSPPGRLGRKASAELRRRQRRLEEQGELTFHMENGTRRLEELLDDGFRIEGSGWKDRRGTAIRSTDQTRHFYSDVAAWAARRGTLRLAFVRLDGRAVAFQYALEDAGRYYFVKGGYAGEYARFGPAKLLVNFAIERAKSSRLMTYEFLGAAEPWKLEWTNTMRERLLIEAFAHSPTGLLEQAARTLLQRVRYAAKRRLVGER